MTKKHSTKKALLASALSLLLCVAMLVGTTFAWFTDSVTSGRNKIQSGNLDVVLEYWDAIQKKYIEVDSNTKLFDDAALWEPGYTEVAYLKVSNDGSLALKYQLAATVYNEILGKTKTGADIKLSDYLVFKAIESDTDLAGTYTRETAMAAAGTEMGLNTYNSEVKALEKKGDADYVALIIYMPTTVGNEANHNGVNVPSIEMGVSLFATQFTYEEDSYDNLYDQASEYLNKDENGNFLITSAGDLIYLAQQVNGGNAYKNKTFLLTADIDLKGMKWTPIGNPSHSFSALFDGQGHTISNYVVDVKEYAGLFGDARNGGDIKNLTVKNATIKATDRAGALIGAGYTTLVNCHAVDCTVSVAPALQANGTYDGGAKAGGLMGQVFEGAGNGLTNCTATNVTVIGYRDIGGVLGMAHDNNVVTDCKAYDSEISYLYLEADQVYGDGSLNGNIGEVVGRVRASSIVTGSEFSNVKTNAIIAYGVKLIPNGENSQIIVNDKEGFLKLSKLSADWREVFTDGKGTEYSNYVNGAGADYYYSGRWTFVLDADIDLNNAIVDPVKLWVGESSGAPTFDGNGHIIKNAKVVTNATTENGAGLFDASSITVKNLKLDNIHVTGSNVGNSTAGVLSGSCNAPVDNITITNSSVTGGKYTGGVVGYGYTDITNCTLTNVTVKGGYKLGGIIGYICASGTNTGDVTGNALTDCTVDGIGNGVFAGGKDKYIVGKVVGNYNCNGLCLENTVTNMTTSATENIGEIEAGKTVTQTGSLVNSGDELQDAINNGEQNIILGGDIDLSGGIIIP